MFIVLVRVTLRQSKRPSPKAHLLRVASFALFGFHELGITFTSGGGAGHRSEGRFQWTALLSLNAICEVLGKKVPPGFSEIQKNSEMPSRNTSSCPRKSWLHLRNAHVIKSIPGLGRPLFLRSESSLLLLCFLRFHFYLFFFELPQHPACSNIHQIAQLCRNVLH